MSDFLQFVDRVPTLPNRKKITHADSSVEYATVEYADEPVTTGTPLNKANFNKINAVLGYNETSLQKESVVIPSDYETLSYESIAPSWSQTMSFPNISLNLSTIQDMVIGEYTPTLEITNGLNYNFYASSSRDTLVGIWSKNGSSTTYLTSTHFLSTINDNNITNVNYGIFYSNSSLTSTKPLVYKFDLKQNQTNKKIEIGYAAASQLDYAYCKVFASNDDINYTLLSNTSTKNSIQRDVINVNNYRYVKVELYSSSSFVVSRMKVDIQKYKEVYNNNYETNQLLEYINNQRLLIKTPNIIDMIDVVTNSIDGIDCDVILLPNSKYELIYDEENNRFNIGGGNMLFDITLTEAVNQVELNGIYEMLETGKIYGIIINGGASSSGDVYFGNSIVSYANSTYTNSPIIFCKITKDNTFDIMCIGTNGSSSTANFRVSNLNNNEHIKMTGTTYKFSAGTRIIIKEIA